MTRDIVDLFEHAELRGMVRGDDHQTSVDAAVGLLPKITKLQAAILAVIKTDGPMTDEDLELLPRFDRYGPSTIRKRRSELYQRGDLVEIGKRKNQRDQDMTIWALPPSNNQEVTP